MVVLGLEVDVVLAVEEVWVGNLVEAAELGNREEELTARSLVAGVAGWRWCDW